MIHTESVLNICLHFKEQYQSIHTHTPPRERPHRLRIDVASTWETPSKTFPDHNQHPPGLPTCVTLGKSFNFIASIRQRGKTRPGAEGLGLALWLLRPVVR